MMPPSLHLSADDLDALLEGITSPQVTSHIETCALCRRMVDLDRRLSRVLASLPEELPSIGFADQVMARVRVGSDTVLAPHPTRTARELAARRRVWVGGGLTATAVAGGFVWAALNPADAMGFATPAWQQAGQSLWLGVQGLAANTVEQPWFETVRAGLGSPSRAAVALLGAAGLYTLALVGMRRLLTEPAPHASW